MTKPFALVTLLLLAACTAANPNYSADALYCAYEVAGVQSCVGYGKLSAAQKDAENQACRVESGQIVSSCPAGYVGCCKSSTAGFTTTECFYEGDAADLSQACSGSWSTGDGSKNDGGSTNQCTNAEVVCPKGCANLETDVNNCGSCGYACPAGTDGTTAVCNAGVCGVSGTTCSQIVSCINTQTDQDGVNACIAGGSALAQQQYNAAINCITNTCANQPTTAPDMGTTTCGLQADCHTCVQTGTSPTNQTFGSCTNAEGTLASDPLCGKCVDQVIACIGPATT